MTFALALRSPSTHLALVLLVVGCGSRASPSPGDDPAGATDAGWSPPIAATQSNVCAPDAAPPPRSDSGNLGARCGEPLGPEVPTNSAETFASQLVRRWMLCSAQSVFGTSDEVGLEIASDGRWYKLTCDASGAVVRAVGFDTTGTWSLTDPTTSDQLNLAPDGRGGAFFAFPVFSANPVMMRMDQSMDNVIDYVAALPNETCAPRDPCTPPLGRPMTADLAPRCTQPQGPQVAALTEQAVTSRLVRRWMLCDAKSWFGTTDDVGVEFTADGHWYKLVCDASGTPVRSSGVDDSGPWQIYDTSVTILGYDPNPFQLNAVTATSGTYMTRAGFSDDPVAVRLGDADYVPAIDGQRCLPPN